MPPLTTNEIVALLVAVSFAAGLNVYATAATLGLLARAGLVDLPGQLGVLEHWWLIGIALALWGIEFVADKVPVLDVLWNTAHLVIRVPAAALLAYSGAAALGPGWQAAATAAGGLIAALAASGKTATHASIAASPEPFSNIALSLVEDLAAIGLLWFATAHPFIAAAIVLAAVGAVVVLLRSVLSAVRALLAPRRQREGRSVTRT